MKQSVMEMFKILEYEDEDFICISNANGKEMEIKLIDYPEFEPQLHEMNASGSQIYFTPNKPIAKAYQHWASQGQFLTNSDINKVTAHFIEIDGVIPEGLSREEEAAFRKQLLEEQKEKILSFPVKPTFMIVTRKSIHTFWVVTDGDLEGFSERQDRLNAYFGADRSIRELKRLMRAPGFKHNKGRYEYDVEIIWFEPDNKYTIEELFQYIPELPKQKAVACDVDGTIKYGLGRIADCEFFLHCFNNQKDLPEPDWHSLAGQLKPFKDGRAAFHSISAGYDKNGQKYNPDKTNNKFDNYSAGPMRCQTICDKTGFSCPKFGSCPAKSPADLFRHPYDMGELIKKLKDWLTVTDNDDTFSLRNKCLKFIELYMYNTDSAQAKEFIKTFMKEYVNSKRKKALGPETLEALVQSQAKTFRYYGGNLVQTDKSGILEEEPVSIMSDADTQEALAYLRNHRLMNNIQNDLTEYGGLRNEVENKLTIYFAATSRKMDKPISLTAFAQSASGKSFVTNTVAEFMPPEECIMLTSVSSKAFDHMV